MAIIALIAVSSLPVLSGQTIVLRTQEIPIIIDTMFNIARSLVGT